MRFIPFPASILSTKNAHKFCTFLLFAFTKVFTHVIMFFSLFFMVLTCYNPCSYPIWLHFSTALCHRRMHKKQFLFYFLFFWMQAGSVRLARALEADSSSFFCFVYSNLRAFQSVTESVCLFCFAWLVCSSSIPPIQRDALRF